VQVAVQVWPIKAPAQPDGQVPLTRLAVGTDEQLVGGAVEQRSTHDKVRKQGIAHAAPG